MSAYYESACVETSEYYPNCSFPFLPTTWGTTSDGNSTSSDCRLTFSEFTGNNYNIRCALYGTIALFPALISRNFVKTLLVQTNGKMNTNIQLCYVNQFLSLIHLFMCIDPNAWANRISFTVIALCQGLSASCAYLVCVILVTNWIAIIDGGKSRKPPRWAIILRNICVSAMFIHDCGLCIAEIYVGEAANDGGAIDGTTNAIKSAIFVVLIMIYFALTLRYAVKITRTLRGGGGGGGGVSKEEKKIRKLCNATSVCFFMVLGYKVRAILSNVGKTVWSFPPCTEGEGGFVSMLQIMFLVVSYSLVYTCNPDKGKPGAIRQIAKNTLFASTALGSSKASSRKGSKGSGMSSGMSGGVSSSGSSMDTSSALSSASSSASSSVSSVSSVSSASVHPEDDDADLEQK